MKRIAFSLTLLCLLIFACTNDPESQTGTTVEEDLRKQNDSLSAILTDLRVKLDSLKEVRTHDEDGSEWFNAGIHAKPLLENGIEDPANFIKSELEKRTDLIPLEAVVGGTMVFRRIEILGKKWILAEYDDGHILGRSIYEYQWNKNKGIRFTLLDSATY